MLQVRDLRKRYRSGTGTQTVFDQLELQVGDGEVVALLGASGSGKTTLLNLLAGIDSPDAGHVSIDGTDVHALPEPARTLYRRHHIGFVFQFFNLIPTLTVGENVTLPMELVNRGAAVCRERSAYLLAEVGLGGFAQRFPETLSGGEQQRTAIARALAHEPELLLADEPTGNLDEDTGGRVMAVLTRLAREHGTTMLLVTHSSRVASVADRVLRLRQGRIEAVTK